MRQEHHLHQHEQALRFIVKRVVRTGMCRRADLSPYFFDRSSAGGHSRDVLLSSLMSQSLLRYPDTLARTGAGRSARVVLAADPIVPLWAQCTRLLDDFAHDPRPENTGIHENEVPIFIPLWSNPGAIQEEVLRKILWAFQPKETLRMGINSVGNAKKTLARAIRIEYVGLREGESYRWRLVQPIGLERLGDQARLIALDLDREGPAEDLLRTFVIARIRAVDDTVRVPQKRVFNVGGDDSTVRVPVQWNPRLTPDQIDALTRELGVRDGWLTMNRRTKFEFMRRFAGDQPTADVVWPIIHYVNDNGKDQS